MNRFQKGAATLLLASLALAIGLLRRELEAQPSAAVPAGLLYLPKGPYLRATALGHEQTLADLIYIWAIQYYSNYSEKSVREGYLNAVFHDAITDLDPRFTEAYVIGAMIMSLEYKGSDDALKLFDKGLAVDPKNWELAYWAGWECYSHASYGRAREYWLQAYHSGKAPDYLIRLAARMLEKQGDMRSAIAEYERLLETTDDPRTREIITRWLERIKTQKNEKEREPAPRQGDLPQKERGGS